MKQIKIESFYNDFAAWLDSNNARQAASLNKSGIDMTTEDCHEYWLIAIGLDETSWFIYCGQYDAEVVEDD